MKIELTSTYDKRTANVVAKQKDGYTFIRREQIRSAEKRARLIKGDYFPIPSGVIVY